MGYELKCAFDPHAKDLWNLRIIKQTSLRKILTCVIVSVTYAKLNVLKVFNCKTICLIL